MEFANCSDIDISYIENPMSLSMCDLVEQYHQVYVLYQKQKTQIDEYKQKVHVLKQDKALKEGLIEELQTRSDEYDLELENTKQKYLFENKDLHNRLIETKDHLQKLQLENESLTNKLTVMNNQSHYISSSEINKCNENETTVTNERMEYLTNIENSYLELVEKIEKLEIENSQLSSQVIQLQVE